MSTNEVIVIMNGGSFLFKSDATREEKGLARKFFVSSLTLSLIYLILGFKWFYTFILGNALDEWMFLFTWPIYKYLVAFVLFFLVPWYLWRVKWKGTLKELGWQWGNKKHGLILMAIGAVILVGIGFSVLVDPSMKDTYPIERVFVDPTYGSFNFAGFIAMELMYVVLYYIPYEFFFRGFMQFPLAREGKVKTAWVIIYQVAITTAIHWDVPTTELIAAFAFGIIIGILALKLDSIFYGLIFHVGVGLVTNIVCLVLLQGWM